MNTYRAQQFTVSGHSQGSFLAQACTEKHDGVVTAGGVDRDAGAGSGVDVVRGGADNDDITGLGGNDASWRMAA